MKYRNTLEAIHANLEELQDLLNRTGDDFSRIDLDLALSKLRNTYDMLLLIRKDLPEKTVQKIEDAKETIPEKEDKRLKEDIVEKVKEEVKQETRKEAEPSASTKQVTETLQDKYRSKDNSLNEKMAQKYQDVSSRIKSNPISSIRNAIGVNEKFLFLNELFDGDKKVYDDTLTILDSSNNFNEAYNYLIENFRWDMDDETVQQLLELIRRKYIPHNDEE